MTFQTIAWNGFVIEASTEDVGDIFSVEIDSADDIIEFLEADEETVLANEIRDGKVSSALRCWLADKHGETIRDAAWKDSERWVGRDD